MGKKLSSAEIREAFCKFFEQKGHTRVISSPLIPAGDPTLLFTNAGMVQFKQIFLGDEKRAYQRAVSVQKCMRAGGKHNDLENVGKTARHHTFFEMLGNFSFGDYFKPDAIEYGWEFVTQIMGLSPEHLWITVFKDDEESAFLWAKKVRADRIVKMGEKDNFWQMGDTGPCGPCSEIYFDQGPEISCGKSTCGLGCDCDRYLEIWNLVFMQFNRNTRGELLPLPKPSIDTGMGLERISAVCQGVKSNYNSDLFKPIIGEIEKITGTRYGQNPSKDVSVRVIADHIRAITFLIADSVHPSNEGRGYVLRRIMRRAARHGRFLGMSDPFLFQLTDTVIIQMKPFYPELDSNQSRIRQMTQGEEERFIHTLNIGMKLIEELFLKMKRDGEKTVPPEALFKLYDTYGFPLDLLEDIAVEEGFNLDIKGFELEMENQKKRARAASRFGTEDSALVSFSKEILKEYGKTKFLGYDSLEGQSTLIAMLNGTERVKRAREGNEVFCVFKETPFYGEGGGQVGDQGTVSGETVLAEIQDALKPAPELIVHKVKVVQGELIENSTYVLEVDEKRRKDSARNHTATHLLHAVLREVLGDHVKQAGSYVDPARLRFDFNHFFPLTRKELDKIERLMNERVRKNVPVHPKIMGLEEALKEGALAFFGDKYGDEVRVIQIENLSQELCGGTHCRATGDIGVFKIVSESSIAAGIRRIEAVTGEGAYELIKTQESQFLQMAENLKVKPAEAPQKLLKLISSLKEKEKEITSLKSKSISPKNDRETEIKKVNGTSVLIKKMGAMSPKDLRSAMDEYKNLPGIDVIILGSSAEGKVYLTVSVSPSKTNRFHAGEIVRELSVVVEGTGGGKPEMAQGGGKNPEKLEEALLQAEKIIQKHSQTAFNG
ncbi:MAG: alanine--tRNA ligase [Nitrospirae bacterium]|nr:alanine--tRNA ligase [Nitrospirota bacterium]MBI3353082.1 alanine--tRNA ligase [Nitrospirota bacterium]